jgi:hypothetical protein
MFDTSLRTCLHVRHITYLFKCLTIYIQHTFICSRKLIFICTRNITMSSSSKYSINVHCNGETYEFELYGFCFRNTDTIRLTIKRNSNFLHLKKQIESCIGSGLVSQITYQNPIYFESSKCKFYSLKVRDDEDVEYMFVSHEHSGCNSIELYITLKSSIPSQQSQITN